MERTSWNGRRRPVATDALRILTVVHQLGRPVPASGFVSRLDGEGRLRRLDHLIRHPVDLAFALMLGRPSDRQRSTLARDVRSLLPESSADAHRPATIHFPRASSWERWDDAWAHLACRNLLRIHPHGDPPADLSFLVTEGGAAWLERHYLSEPSLKPYLERCRIVHRHLPRPDGKKDSGLELDVSKLEQRFEAYQRQERWADDEDLLSRLFQATFGELP